MYVHRSLEREIEKHIDAPEIIAIIGTRQCGKTTLVRHIIEGLPGVNIISFDDVKQLKLFENDIDSFIERNIRGYRYLFIDEVQYAKDSGKKLKYIVDSQDIKIFISGSSAAELSIQSIKHLVGRIFIFRLYTFSFDEFLSYKDEGLHRVFAKGDYGEDVLVELNRYMDEFIKYGGYPRVVLETEKGTKVKILENIYSSYILREIQEIMQISDNDKMIALLKALASQTGNLLNYSELAQTIGSAYHEVMRYLQVLEETFICKRIPSYHTNKHTEIVKAPKLYFYDSGFRNICIDDFSHESGNIYENLIFSEIVKLGREPKYWRSKSKAEVDFVIEKDGLTAIEVKKNLASARISRSFHSFVGKYHPLHRYIVSRTYEDEESGVRFLPFAKFLGLLQQGSIP